MLTQLTTLKSRLAIAPSDITNDALLTRAIEAFSTRFDRECNRILARTVNITQEFSADEIEIPAICYPIESITKFETKSSQSPGWALQAGVDYIIHTNCVISLAVPLIPHPPATVPALARVTYTGGYVLPGTPDPQPLTPDSQPVRLPADLEHAIVEQVTFWFGNKEKLGEIRNWPAGGNYVQLADTDLLPSVRATLKRYTRFSL